MMRDLLELSGQLNRSAETVRDVYYGREQKIHDTKMFMDAVARCNGVHDHEIVSACLLFLSDYISRQRHLAETERATRAVIGMCTRSEGE